MMKRHRAPKGRAIRVVPVIFEAPGRRRINLSAHCLQAWLRVRSAAHDERRARFPFERKLGSFRIRCRDYGLQPARLFAHHCLLCVLPPVAARMRSPAMHPTWVGHGWRISAEWQTASEKRQWLGKLSRFPQRHPKRSPYVKFPFDSEGFSKLLQRVKHSPRKMRQKCGKRRADYRRIVEINRP